MRSQVLKFDLEYLAPPKVGNFADLDPAVIMTPSKGFEIGYVPTSLDRP
jgi:hypothetical protein